ESGRRRGGAARPDGDGDQDCRPERDHRLADARRRRMKLINVVLAAAVVLANATAGAQFAGHPLAQTPGDTLIVMTVPLKHLSAKDAVQLLQPFVTTLPFEGRVGGGVFPVPN